MNATINRMQIANERAQRALCGKFKEIENDLRGGGQKFTPETVIKWFFSWTLCACGLMLAMTILSTLAKVLKMLVP